ncbi:hypothetical protein Droror1_Dr00007499 [Drosera rotundifolia]
MPKLFLRVITTIDDDGGHHFPLFSSFHRERNGLSGAGIAYFREEDPASLRLVLIFESRRLDWGACPRLLTREVVDVLFGTLLLLDSMENRGKGVEDLCLRVLGSELVAMKATKPCSWFLKHDLKFGA